MSIDDESVFWSAVLAMVAVLVLATACVVRGKARGYDEAQADAVRIGAARYVSDRGTGKPRFEWVTNCVVEAQR